MPVAATPGATPPARRETPALQRPTLTVLIPVYNEERTVEELLRRVAEGPYPDKEVIVIDDGSSDATPRLLEAWAGRPGFILLRHDKNRGKGAAVRTGLAHVARRGHDHPGRRPGVRPGGLPPAGRADPAGRGAGGLRLGATWTRRGGCPGRASGWAWCSSTSWCGSCTAGG